MIENSYYTSEFHGDYDIVSIGRLDLEEGGSIPDCLLAVTTWGELNEARDNAILITTWYSGTHQIWRDVYVGPDHALNPERYFIVAINQIGNGLSVSPHNADGPNADIAMARFPKVRIGDDVVAQERLLREHFGIERLATRHRRVDGRAADLRMGGAVPGQGAPRRADRRHRAEHPARLPLHPGAVRAVLVRPGLERRRVQVQRRRRRRAQAARRTSGR